MRGAFNCTLQLEGMAVMVVDDVMTTGASLDEVARCLKARGAARVENLVVARTPAPH
jgi:predicted amidophosphoribosyltransferase